MRIGAPIRTIIAAGGLAAAVVTPAWALMTITGTVDALDVPRVTVAGQRYTITPDTDVVDRGGHRLKGVPDEWQLYAVSG